MAKEKQKGESQTPGRGPTERGGERRREVPRLLISDREDWKEGAGPRKAPTSPCPFLGFLGAYKVLRGSEKRERGTEPIHGRLISAPRILEFSMRQRRCVCFLFCFGKEEANAALCLFRDGCCEQWGATTGQLPEDDDSDCVWPPSGDAKELEGRGPDWPCVCIIGVLSGFEL